MSEKNLSIKVSFDQQVISFEEPSERILEIALQAPDLPADSPRPLLNLAIVLDRSGSMSGEKLEYVKQAASHVVSLLKDTDRLSLVKYDDEVEVPFHNAPLTLKNRAVLQQTIRSIQTGGSTNLAGGWLTGCQETAVAAQSNSVNRTLLLTDGLANVGITDPETLATHARELAVRGVSTSTFGVGTDFHHELLEAMANQGGGRFYFIEVPEDIPNIFNQEFLGLIKLFAREIEVTVSFPEGLQVDLPGDWRCDCPEPGKLRIYIGSLVAGEKQEVYVKVSVPAGWKDKELPFKAAVLAKGEKGQLLEATSEQALHLGSKAEVEAAPKDALVLERFAQVELAHQAAEALKLELRGRRQEAHQLLQTSLSRHRDRIDPDLDQHYQTMSDRMRRGMDELDRKRSHYDSYTLKQRREEYQSYRLVSNAAGHLVFDAQGHLVLLGTGSPVSIGIREQWHFLGRHVQLQRDHLGVTPETLSHVIRLPIDFMLGMDVLHRMWFAINQRNNEILFSNEPLPLSASPIPLNLVMHIPSAELVIAGSPRQVMIDTGAKLSYLSKKVLAGLEIMNTERDFYPGLGEFETEVFQSPLVIAGETILLRCGILPDLLEKKLLASGVQGILGAELFNYFAATFAMREMLLSLDRYH